MKDVRFSLFDVKLVRKEDSGFLSDSIHAIFRFLAVTEREAKRKALEIPTDTENWKVEGCWRV
jgi:hypothetical protein